MSLLQVWFWFTITAAIFVGWELSRAPLQDWRDDPTSHQFVEPCGDMEGDAACWLCGYLDEDHSDRLHESTVRIVDDGGGT